MNKGTLPGGGGSKFIPESRLRATGLVIRATGTKKGDLPAALFAKPTPGAVPGLLKAGTPGFRKPYLAATVFSCTGRLIIS